MTSQLRSLLLVNPFTLLHYYFKFPLLLFGIAFLFLLDQCFNVSFFFLYFFSYAANPYSFVEEHRNRFRRGSNGLFFSNLSSIGNYRDKHVWTKETRTVLEGTHSLRRRRNSYRKKRVSFFRASLSLFFFFLPFRFFLIYNRYTHWWSTNRLRCVT